MPISPGTLLNNRYRILSVLGQGGMGAVYHAIDENLGIAVAVKENLFLTDEYSRQFQREASILASLRHPNLPRVGDYFTLPNQGQYLIMDYIEGEDLRMRLERMKTLPEKDVILIGVLICDALAYLHSRKPPVVHRDIKPGNIKITPEGEVILVDFGLAKVMAVGQATTTGARAMTPGYSPPEQYGTARTDARSDVYSLGATLYAALTGLIPEDGLARATGKVSLTPVRSLLPKTSRRLAAVLEKALAVEPDERYQTAEAFRSALLEAGEISMASLGRITIPPPPVLPALSPDPNSPAHPSVDSLLADDPAVAKHPSQPRPAAAGRPYWIILLVFFALVSVAGVYFLRPDLFSPAFAPPQPTPALTATPDPPTPTLPQPSPVAVIPATPTLPAATSTPQASLTPTLRPTAVVSTTPIGGGPGQLAFSSNRGGSFQVWLMNSDGKNLVQLTRMSNGACQPAWSPAGDQIVFVSPCQPRNDTFPGGRLYIMNADGSDQKALPIPVNLEGDYDPAWSPDGKRIAYTSVQTGRPQIYVFSLQDNTAVNLSNSRAFDSNPAFSPDGKNIAFVRQIATYYIFLMSDKGENQVQFDLSDVSLVNQSPAWTPDGQLILFSQAKGNLPIPWLMGQRFRDQGTNQEFRVPPTGQDVGPVSGAAVSPDGFLIAYESWPDGKNHDIFIMTLAGADRSAITNDPAYDFGPAWRPQKTTP